MNVEIGLLVPVVGLLAEEVLLVMLLVLMLMMMIAVEKRFVVWLDVNVAQEAVYVARVQLMAREIAILKAVCVCQTKLVEYTQTIETDRQRDMKQKNRNRNRHTQTHTNRHR